MKKKIETDKLVARGYELDKLIKANPKNEHIPIVSCPDGKVMLMYFWRKGVLESIWAAKHPAYSVATKISNDILVYKLISHEPEENYIRHMIIDDKDVDSLIIWLYAINGVSFSYRSIVSDPYFVPEKILGDYLRRYHAIKKSSAENFVKAFPSMESWPFAYYGEETKLYPKWVIDENVEAYKEDSQAEGKNISSRNVKPRKDGIPKNYVLDGEVFSLPFGRRIKSICDSLYLPFNKETVTLDLLKEYVTIDDLHHVSGMGFATVQNFIKELEEHGIELKQSGSFSLSRNNVNPYGIDRDKLLDMSVREAEHEYFSIKAERALHDYLWDKGIYRYGDCSMKEVVDGISVKTIRKAKGTREPGITMLVNELRMAGIDVPEE